MDEIEYFDDNWDSGKFFVCINRYYIYVADPKDQSPEWRLICPETDYGYWDALHQRIYRNFRSDPIERKDLPPNLPTPPSAAPLVPPIPKPPAPPPVFQSEEFPRVARYMELLTLASTVVYLVLLEDLYETTLGDGEFHYPEAAFISYSEVEAYIAACEQADEYREWHEYHVRRIQIRLQDDILDCPEMEHRLYDHFGARDCLHLLEKQFSLLDQ